MFFSLKEPPETSCCCESVLDLSNRLVFNIAYKIYADFVESMNFLKYGIHEQDNRWQWLNRPFCEAIDAKCLSPTRTMGNISNPMIRLTGCRNPLKS